MNPAGGDGLPAAPLEASDPGRAQDLKLKVAARIKDVDRHLTALRVAMADFGDDFDAALFAAAHASADPAELNRVKAVERGIDQLYNYMAELTMFGLELAGWRRRGDELNARQDFAAMRRAQVLSGPLVQRLQQLRELRRLLVHDYAGAPASQIHAAALLLVEILPGFYSAYIRWIRSGFAVPYT